jgi:hypothetical protein
MSEAYVVTVGGLKELQDFVGDIPGNLRTTASKAVNKALRTTRASAAKQMLAQINFGRGYLNQNKRFEVSKFSTKATLEGKITGRSRPTSMSRFATQSGKGVKLQVAPGVSLKSKRMFFMKLRSGADSIENKFNMGLAIRLRAGEKVDSKKKMVKISGNLYLLYGPSVDQVFSSVADDAAPGAADLLQQEFNRLLEL